MPLNALESAEWREMLGNDSEHVYEEFVNTPGNLTLAVYTPELSDSPFVDKKASQWGADIGLDAVSRSLRRTGFMT